MKSILSLSVMTLLSLNVFASAASKNIMVCTDKKNRILSIEQLTGASGSMPGDKLAIIQNFDGKMMKVATVLFEHKDVTFPATYQGAGIKASVSSIISMNLPAGYRTGSLSLDKEKPVSMICQLEANKPPQ